MKSLVLHRVDHREVDSNRDRGRSVGVPTVSSSLVRHCNCPSEQPQYFT